MSLEKLKRKFKSCERLLENDTLGSFDFATYSISLDSIHKSEFEAFQKAITTNEYFALSKVMPLAVHEFTHFIDSTSTLWGMNYLKKMNDAYCSNNIKGGNEEEFYKAKKFFDYTRSLRLPNYYTLIEKDTTPTQPWQAEITIGKQFGLNGKLSKNPILFSRFYNAYEKPLARSPVSTVSILEASAMSNEMVARLALINNKLDGDEKIVEMSEYQKELFRYIYNQNITEYSVCVHILANQLQCKELFIAFQICSIITRLVLNFPKKLIDNLIKSEEIYAILGIPKTHEFGTRFKAGIKSHDLGILYYLFVCALPKNTSENQEKMIDGIEEALHKFNLSFDLIAKEARSEIEKIANELRSSKLKSIQILAEAGKDNFNKIPLNSTTLNFSNLSFPNVYLGDGIKVAIFKNDNNILNNTEIDDIFDELYEGQEWVERFSEACTI